MIRRKLIDPSQYVYTRMCWYNMLWRCENPKAHNYHLYGARGIVVCAQWHSFETFLDDMGTKPRGLSLNRRDNDKGYEHGNCRWATAGEQLRNCRNTLLVPWEGKMIPAVDVAVEIGADPLPFARRIWQRVYRSGYTLEDALYAEDGRGGNRRSLREETLFATIDGVRLTVMEHCAARGLKYNTVIKRISRGMNNEDAILAPLSKNQYC